MSESDDKSVNRCSAPLTNATTDSSTPDAVPTTVADFEEDEDEAIENEHDGEGEEEDDEDEEEDEDEKVLWDRHFAQMGFAEEPSDESPLTSDNFPSKAGGKPVKRLRDFLCKF